MAIDIEERSALLLAVYRAKETGQITQQEAIERRRSLMRVHLPGLRAEMDACATCVEARADNATSWYCAAHGFVDTRRDDDDAAASL